ncbi:protein unc-93 homolog A-like [Ciona intestinalis]
MVQTATKYFLIVVIGTTINVTAYVGLLDLQSSIHISHNLGTTSLSITYGCGLLLSLFVTPLLLCNLGAKWTLILGEFGFSVLTLANFYPGYATIIPGSIVGSMGESFVWAAGQLYIANLFLNRPVDNEHADANSNGEIPDLWFGRFFGILKTCVIWANLISYGVLYGFKSSSISNFTNGNYSNCASNFCYATTKHGSGSYIPHNRNSLYILLGVYLGLQLFSVGLHVFYLEPAERSAARIPNGTAVAPTSILNIISSSVKSTAYHLTSTDQILMTPIIFYYGFMISYSFSDFTRAFVSCTLGVEEVGLVMAVYGVFNAIMGFGAGKASHMCGLPIVYIVTCLFDIGNYVAQLLFRPEVATRYWVFAFAAMLGTSDGIWQTVISITEIGYFRDRLELAFAGVAFWQVLAMTVGFIMSGRVCLRIRIILLISTVVLGCFGYGITETKRRNSRKYLSEENERILAN